MSSSPDVLAHLRRRLSDLESRQRSVGGASRGFLRAIGHPSASDGGADGSGGSTWSGEPVRGASGTKAPSTAKGSVPLTVDPLDLEWLDVDGADEGWVPDEVPPVDAGFSSSVAIEAGIGMPLTRHCDEALTSAADQVVAQRASADVALVNVLAELESRGLGSPGGLSRIDWLRSLDPGLSAGQAKAFVTVARAVGEPWWAALRAQVSRQQVSVGKAAQIIDFHARVSPVADPIELEQAVLHLTELAAGSTGEQLSRHVREQTDQIRPPKDLDRMDAARREGRGLWLSAPNASGMVRLSGMFDPEGAAVIKSAIDPLAQPCPERDEHGHTVRPDPRPAHRRHADALLEVVRRGVSSPGAAPSTDKAKVVVTIDLDVLEGRVRGAGSCLSGDVLSPATVRRLACDAGVIPVVLGSDGEPLDVGRLHRLVTPAMRTALWLRDRACTFPGCTVPAQWTDAHHVRWWWRDHGTTGVLNLALLCARHHTYVHDRDLTASVTATGVIWHVPEALWQRRSGLAGHR